jgi:hypothetical protein
MLVDPRTALAPQLRLDEVGFVGLDGRQVRMGLAEGEADEAPMQGDVTDPPPTYWSRSSQDS